MRESIAQHHHDTVTKVLISPEFTSSSQAGSKVLQLGIMASGSGTNFAVVAKAIADRQLNAEIKVLIYNHAQAKVKEHAEKYKIPTVFLDHRQYSSRESLDQEIVKVFKTYDVDLVVMAGWMRITTQVLLDGYPHRVINIHPSLLPSFKGNKAIEQALQSKVKITGCTVHLVSLEVDSGEIIIQAAVPVLEDDTLDTLHSRIQAQEHQILPQAIAMMATQLPVSVQ